MQSTISKFQVLAMRLRRLVVETARAQGKPMSMAVYDLKPLAAYCLGRKDAASSGAHHNQWKWLAEQCDAVHWQIENGIANALHVRNDMLASRSTFGLLADRGTRESYLGKHLTTKRRILEQIAEMQTLLDAGIPAQLSA